MYAEWRERAKSRRPAKGYKLGSKPLRPPMKSEPREIKLHGYPRMYYHTKEMKKEYNVAKSVRCIDTGQVFVSIVEAGRAMNTNTRSISKVCKGILGSVNGLRWEYA
jgi:hypothetical protein